MDCPALKLFCQFAFWGMTKNNDDLFLLKNGLGTLGNNNQPLSFVSLGVVHICLGYQVRWIEVLILKWTLLHQCQAEDVSFSSKKSHCTQKSIGCTKMSLDNETTTCSRNFSFLPRTSLLIQQSTIQITGHGHPLMSRCNLFPVDCIRSEWLN